MASSKLAVRNVGLEAILQKDRLRILVVVRDHMSGVLYAVPSLRLLRENFPNSEIYLLVNHYAAPILKDCPYIDKMVPFYRFSEHENWVHKFKSLGDKVLAFARLYQRVDLVIHLRYVGGQTLLFSKALGNPFQVGYAQGRNDQYLDINLGQDDDLHNSRHRNAKILEAIGVEGGSHEMEIWIPQAAKDWVAKWLASQGVGSDEPIIVFHPGCHWGCNEWLTAHWTALGNEIYARSHNKIIITGSSCECSLGERIAQGMEVPPLIATGETTLIQFAALLERARAVISIDTSPTQICQALKKPSVILMGAGNPAWNGPLAGEPMIMLQKLCPNENKVEHCNFAAGICHTDFCESRLRNISVADVITALEKVCAGEYGITAYGSMR